ncbi:MAG: diguanylate cyclase [Candidatus Omnitrophota bacterium]
MKIEDGLTEPVPSYESLSNQVNVLSRTLAELEKKDSLRVHTEKALIKSKATAYAFMNATSDLAVLLDTRGIILEVNEAAVRRVEKTVAELTGKCIFDFFPKEFKEFRKVYINIVQQTKEPLRFQDEYKGLTFNVCIYPILDIDADDVDRLAVFVSDDTEHRRNEELLFRYSQILSTVHDPMASIDKNYIFRTVNEAYTRIYKKSSDELVGHTVEDILGKEFFEEKMKGNIDICFQGETVQQQEWFDFPDNQRRFMYLSYYPLWGKDDRVNGVVLNSVDITKNKELEDELKRLSVTDRLTQIFNREKFDQAFKEEVKRLKRYGTELSLIMFDIDHFKQINDRCGHDGGDRVLVTLVQLVKKCIRETDIFSRWGGEEFMLLLPHTNLENASKLAERIRIRMMNAPLDGIGSVTCSFGVATFAAEDTEETLLKRVDNALYDSKRSGRNRVTVG